MEFSWEGALQKLQQIAKSFSTAHTHFVEIAPDRRRKAAVDWIGTDQIHRKGFGAEGKRKYRAVVQYLANS